MYQGEVVVLLEVAEGETLPPREVFTMLQVGGAPDTEL